MKMLDVCDKLIPGKKVINKRIEGLHDTNVNIKKTLYPEPFMDTRQRV